MSQVIALQEPRQIEKILLVLLPFHPPLIPPLGMACLKSALEPHGYRVKTVDANAEGELRGYYSQYFAALARHIPPERRANFYNIGNDAMSGQLMAHFNRRNDAEYRSLVREIVSKTFFSSFDDALLDELGEVVDEYYAALERYLLALYEREQPDVLGLSVFKGTLASSLFAFHLAKQRRPATLTVMGGGVFADQLAYGSPELRSFLERTPYIDRLILGEGENLLLQLVQGRLPATQRVYTFRDSQPALVDVAAAKLPELSDYDLDFYPYLASYTSRSCPYQCTFCAETILWGRYRKKTPERIVDELAELYRRYGRQLFLMCDSLLNPTIDKLSRRLIERHADLPVYFDGYLRLDRPVCELETTMRWRRGGYYRARLGVESGSQEMLDRMDKRISTEQIRAGVGSLAHAGIKTTTYWIVGYPGETEDDFQATLNLVEKMAPDIYEAEANPFWYYPSGQVGSDAWAEASVPLYPESAREMLILQTRVLDLDPPPRERYERLNRFVRHCESLGIPNPYSLSDIYRADQRWKRLHDNAVPPLSEFLKDGDILKHMEVPRWGV